MVSATERALSVAVESMQGLRREGQHLMAEAVFDAFQTQQHLLVQAGTGTGKSLGYVVPALVHLANNPNQRIVIATATLALQTQLATKDIPLALDAVTQTLRKTPRAALLKGRNNYACLYRVRDGVAEGQSSLLGADEIADVLRASGAGAESVLGAEVVALRQWAESQLEHGKMADRDDAPAHGPRAWAQISVSGRECLGKTTCPFGEECFVEKSREKARSAALIVTNHALLAIDASHGGTALPAHDLVIIDEAHELVSRVTGAASAELSAQMIDRVGRRASAWLDDDLAVDFLLQSDALSQSLQTADLARIDNPNAEIINQLILVRDLARTCVSQLEKSDAQPDQRQAAAAMKEIFDVTERMAKLSNDDVLWVGEREQSSRHLVIAPLSVGGLLREKILKQNTVVFTSATLTIGGDFSSIANSVGLHANEKIDHPQHDQAELAWSSVDVGSPFNYARQGICYLAAHLPPPSRDGVSTAVLTEIAELVWAANGRTLGLFSSQRAAEAAAVFVRKELPKQTVLCQGDQQLSELLRRFAAEPETSLFGTISLWQGVDIPGDTCELVIIDKIPFPRPDEPLILARQDAVARSGGNGFMQVAAAHAALLLAQGSGRLIRRASDRGVVAVLDPRLATARYSSYLRKSMPPLWPTSDRDIVIAALQRLAQARSQN